MTINEYQKLAMTTLNKDLSKKEILINGVMGLCGESGEAIDLVKKWLAQGHELDEDKLIKEIGDVAWYIAEIATVLGVTLEDERVCRVTVSPDQLSLAIGKEGQNAKLVARLTGCKIDIKA